MGDSLSHLDDLLVKSAADVGRRMATSLKPCTRVVKIWLLYNRDTVMVIEHY